MTPMSAEMMNIFLNVYGHRETVGAHRRIFVTTSVEMSTNELAETSIRSVSKRHSVAVYRMKIEHEWVGGNLNTVGFQMPRRNRIPKKL